MTTATLPSGTGIVSTYTYDVADRLTNIAHVKGGLTTVASVAYTLDNVGNRTQRVDQQGTHTYIYDDLHRLTSVTYPGPTTTTYGFDAFGNRTSMVDGTGTTSYAYDDADRLTTVTPPSPASAVSYTWDDNGNLTDRGADEFAWDYEDRMVSATVNSVTTTFAYRGDGLRDSRTVGMNTTTFTWDIASGLPVVLDDGNQYVYGAGLASMKQSGNWYYYLADGLGSTMAMVDSSGNSQKSYQYDVYGEVTGGSGSLANEFDFAGQQTDGTGLQYLRARYYDPATGVFLSRDPMASHAAWLRNPTTYVASAPTNFIDPSGLDRCSWRDPWECVKDQVEREVQIVCGLTSVTSPLAPPCEAVANTLELLCRFGGCSVEVITIAVGQVIGEYKLSRHAVDQMDDRDIAPDAVKRAMGKKHVRYLNDDGRCVDGFYDESAKIFVGTDSSTGLITTVIDRYSKSDLSRLVKKGGGCL